MLPILRIPQLTHFMHHPTEHKPQPVPFRRLIRGCLILHIRHASSTKSFGGDGFVSTSAGGSSRPPLTSFVGFEGDESCGASWLAEANAGLVTILVMPLGDNRDGGCDAVTGVEVCACEVGISLLG